MSFSCAQTNNEYTSKRDMSETIFSVMRNYGWRVYWYSHMCPLYLRKNVVENLLLCEFSVFSNVVNPIEYYTNFKWVDHGKHPLSDQCRRRKHESLKSVSDSVLIMRLDKEKILPFLHVYFWNRIKNGMLPSNEWISRKKRESRYGFKQ